MIRKVLTGFYSVQDETFPFLIIMPVSGKRQKPLDKLDNRPVLRILHRAFESCDEKIILALDAKCLSLPSLDILQRVSLNIAPGGLNFFLIVLVQYVEGVSINQGMQVVTHSLVGELTLRVVSCARLVSPGQFNERVLHKLPQDCYCVRKALKWQIGLICALNQLGNRLDWYATSSFA